MHIGSLDSGSNWGNDSTQYIATCECWHNATTQQSDHQNEIHDYYLLQCMAHCVLTESKGIAYIAMPD